MSEFVEWILISIIRAIPFWCLMFGDFWKEEDDD